MKTYSNSDLKKYLNNDWIMRLLEQSEVNERTIRYNKWLVEMDNKRMIYADVYGDLLKGKFERNPKVIDVGGGYTSLTRVLASNCHYTLVDFLAHGGAEEITEYLSEKKMEWLNCDWYETNTEDNYDIVIANDIFPDVDQRMELFIDKFLPLCREIRLVLTYYNSPQFYTTKRIDDPEVMTFLSWDGEITALKLNKYRDRLIDTTDDEINSIKTEKESIYRNGRQVSYIKIRGDI